MKSFLPGVRADPLGESAGVGAEGAGGGGLVGRVAAGGRHVLHLVVGELEGVLVAVVVATGRLAHQHHLK